MGKLFANSGDTDQTPRSAASDLGLHCLPSTFLRVSRLQWVKGDWIHVIDFPPFLHSGLFFRRGVSKKAKRDITKNLSQLRNFLFAFQCISVFLKEVYSKRKEFAPNGSKFFPFKVDPFSEGRQNSLRKLPPLKVYFSPSVPMLCGHFMTFYDICAIHYLL